MSRYFTDGLNDSSESLEHFGIKGQKWRQRRYQNPDGSLTSEGKKRYAQMQTDRKGRYSWTGERSEKALQRKAEKQARESEKNKAAGRERLTNRIDRVNSQAETDKIAARLGDKNIKRSGEAHAKVKDIKELSNEIMADDQRVEAFGKATRNTRTATIAGTAAGVALTTAGAAAIAASGGLSAPIVAGWAVANGATIGLGRKAYNDSFY